MQVTCRTFDATILKQAFYVFGRGESFGSRRCVDLQVLPCGWVVSAGRVCEVDVDECLAHNCRNGARCIDGEGSYLCECQPGWEGPLCQFVSLLFKTVLSVTNIARISVQYVFRMNECAA